MKIQDQVCSLEQAKKLSELGVNSQSLWYYIRADEYEFALVPDGWVVDDAVPDLRYWESVATCHEQYSAFTVAELGVMLPHDLEEFQLSTWYAPKRKLYRSQYRLNRGSISDEDFPEDFAQGTTEAECRASMLIHLLESGKLTPEEVNNRLTS